MERVHRADRLKDSPLRNVSGPRSRSVRLILATFRCVWNFRWICGRHHRLPPERERELAMDVRCSVYTGVSALLNSLFLSW